MFACGRSLKNILSFLIQLLMIVIGSPSSNVLSKILLLIISSMVSKWSVGRAFIGVSHCVVQLVPIASLGCFDVIWRFLTFFVGPLPLLSGPGFLRRISRLSSWFHDRAQLSNVRAHIVPPGHMILEAVSFARLFTGFTQSIWTWEALCLFRRLRSVLLLRRPDS